MSWLIGAIASTLSAIIGSMGLGGGGVLIIYFNLFTDVPQSLAQGINLLFFIPSAIVAIIIYAKKKLIDFKLTICFALFGVVGAVIGSFFVSNVNGSVLARLFAILLLIMGVKQFCYK